MEINVNDREFQLALYKYKETTGKGWQEVVKDQARLLAKRLCDLTPPYSKSTALKAVAIDIGRVYLINSWFEEKFYFKNAKLGERIKTLIKSKNTTGLDEIFEHSSRLKKIHIEAFNPDKLKLARKNGRVNYKHPYSYPMAEQGGIKRLIAEKQRNIATAKSGWGVLYKQLGGNPAAWYSKPVGILVDASYKPDNPFIILKNDVSYFKKLNDKLNITSKALLGRTEDIRKRCFKLLDIAAKESGLA